jgi:hypothetical protein
MHSQTKLYGLQLSVGTYVTLKGSLQWKHCQHFAICSDTAVMHPGMLLVVRHTSQGSVLPHNSSLSAVAVEETTQPITKVV